MIGMFHKRIFALMLLTLISGCVTVENDHDPLEPGNRIIDTFNDGLDRVTVKPLAQGYNAIINKPIRSSISNFYDNTTYPNTVLNSFLQGKVTQGFSDLTRFIINSTIGIVGLFDPASHLGLEKHDEDFGQTLAAWGVSQGAYIVYPFLGPNSARNTPNLIVATVTDPLYWITLTLAPQVTIPLYLLKYVDKRSRLFEASDMRDELAMDPYVFTREAWRQNREYLIHDGQPPTQEGEDDDWDDDFED